MFGFFIFFFIWSMLEVLIIVEFFIVFLGNGGFVMWVDWVFGFFWGFFMGMWKFFSGVINMVVFLVLCMDYLKSIFFIFFFGLFWKFVILVLILFFLFFNYMGFNMVGYVVIILGIVLFVLFIFMLLMVIF